MILLSLMNMSIEETVQLDSRSVLHKCLIGPRLYHSREPSSLRRFANLFVFVVRIRCMYLNVKLLCSLRSIVSPTHFFQIETFVYILNTGEYIRNLIY